MSFGGIISQHLACIEVHYTNEGNCVYHLIILSKTGNSLKISQSAYQLTSLQETISLIKKGTPLILILTGKGIVIRKIQLNEGIDNNSIVNTIFPDVNNEEFRWEVASIVGNEQYIAIIRTKLIMNITGPFLDQGYSIVGLHIGPLILNDFISISKDYDGSIQTGNYSINFLNSRIADIKPIAEESDKKVEFANIEIEERFLLCFAAGFSFYVDQNTGSLDSIETLKENSTNFYFAKRVKRICVGALVGMLFLLLANFLLFDYYNTKQKEISSRTILYTSKLERIDSLTQLLQNREKLMHEFGLLSNNPISFFADQIAASVPENMKLIEMDCFPITIKEMAQDKRPEYQSQILKIALEVSESSVLNKWLREMKGKSWIESIELTEYTLKKANQALVGVTIFIN
jgi:Tfp pilus assembly protein PilN